MNQKTKNSVHVVGEPLAVTYERVDISTMTMQEIVDAAIERGFRPQNKSNCFYHWSASDELAACRFLQSYEQ